MTHVNAVYAAQLALNQHQFDDCITMCSKMLEQNHSNQAAWFLKTRALTHKHYVDDTDLEEEGIAQMIMDEHSIAQQPRPGTSLHTPLADSQSSAGISLRPMTGRQRPLTGFARPSTASRGTTSQATGTSLAQAFHGARPVSVAERYLRLGTQSMISSSAKFIDADKLDLNRYVKHPALAKALCDYLLYCEHNPKKALELCTLIIANSLSTSYSASRLKSSDDWWWKARLGKAFYKLDMLREAQNEFKYAIKIQHTVQTSLELAKIFLRLDQPNSALDTYMQAIELFPSDTSLVIGCARVYEALNDTDHAMQFYHKALKLDSSNVEAIACLASFNFYTDQPEIALRFYRRLLQMGVINTELWNNIGLSCFYSSQYDMALACFDRALMLADDINMADVWYNLGHIGIGIGDLKLAQQCFKISLYIDHEHAESLNNLGVLEARRGHNEEANSYFESAYERCSHLFEPFFNAALLADSMGDMQKSFRLCKRSLEAFPDHVESQKHLAKLVKEFML